MSFLVWSRHKPQIWRQPAPSEGTVLVFDHVPDGYRKASEWILKEWDKTSKVYRLHIPCAEFGKADDLCDYELEFESGPKPRFMGYVEMWPDDHVFELQEIEMDAIPEGDLNLVNWPPPALPKSTKIKLSTLYMCGHCSQRSLMLPNAFTGVTDIQQFILDTVSAARDKQHPVLHIHAFTTLEICQLAAAHFRVELPLVMDQFERLTFGNEPWIVSNPGRATYVRLNPDSHYNDPLVPMWLLNGPFPMSRKVLYEKFHLMLSRAKRAANWTTAEPPSAGPEFQFTIGSSGSWVCAAREVSPHVFRPPYGVTFSEFSKQNASSAAVQASWNTLRSTETVPPPFAIQPKLVFAKNHETLVYPSLESYAHDWFDMKLQRMVLQGEMRSFYETRELQEFDLLNKIYMISKVPRTFVDLEGKVCTREVRFFVDDTDGEKRQRLLHTYGRDHLDHLYNLPIHRIDAKNLYPEENKLLEDDTSARSRWLKALSDEMSC